MSERVDAEKRLEVSISHLLRAGVVLAAGLLIVGWLLDEMGQPAGGLVMDAGIRVLISTPIIRVAATFVLFVRQRDLLYSIITALVLAFLAVGVLGGLEL